jgi:hypothetical protein
MTNRTFERIALELFGEVLCPAGFVHERSQHCTFYRKIQDDLYHVVLPDPGTRGVWYDVKVFPTSPVLEPLFEERFPDNLSVPSDSSCYLSATGVGPDQETYHCRTEEGFRRNFSLHCKPALTSYGVPYLDAVIRFEDLVPLVGIPVFRGLALSHVGKYKEARKILLKERSRFLTVKKDKLVAAFLERIDSSLTKFT